MQKSRIFLQQLRVSHLQRLNDHAIQLVGREVARLSSVPKNSAPVIIFNASTRISGISQNAAFSLLSSWALRLSGERVIHFVCAQGMTRCVLGTNRDDVWREPPCARCIRQSSNLFTDAQSIQFAYRADPILHDEIESLNIQQLTSYSYKGIPLGELVLPSIRWVLRRHHLFDDHNTKFLYRQFILSAHNIHERFSTLITAETPKAVVVFNGMFYPEAIARFVAHKNNVRVITHEAGIRPLSCFFTDGEATAYPIEIPRSFKLSKEQNQRLDAYLDERFKGKFSMADVQFWPEMKGLPEELIQDINQHKQVVPIFTNVIFDTSQPHSNILFSDMFTWLDNLLPIFKKYSTTLFIVRAHPDETRPGKTSQETVSDWAVHRRVQDFKNVRFIPPEQYLSSYDLIKKAKFVLVYNSTIGLEASILGVPVLSAGRARFTQYPTVYFPKSARLYHKQLIEFLSTRKVVPPPSHRIQARRFLYYQLFRTSLPFEQFLQPDGIWPGFVKLKKFAVADLLPENSKTMQIIVDGVRLEQPFLSNE